MRFEQNKSYKVIKPGALLQGLPTAENKQEEITLLKDTLITYVGDEYRGIDYDVIQPPYFRYRGKDYIFQPSSFSGLIPEGYLIPIA